MPFLFVTCTRSGDQVECVVQQRMLGVIPFKTTTIPDLKAVRLHVEEGTSTSSKMRTTDAAFIILSDANGDVDKVMLGSYKNLDGTKDASFIDRMQGFLESNESEYSDWTASLFGYLAWIPAALGLLFLSLVSWDFLGTKLKSLKSNKE